MWPAFYRTCPKITIVLGIALATTTGQILEGEKLFEFHNGFWINLDCHRLQAAGHTAGEEPNVKNALEDEERLHTLHPSLSLSRELIMVLEECAPDYQKSIWPRDRTENARWIRGMRPLVGRYGSEIARDLASAYETAWPKQPIRVDVTEYANWAGAYTTVDPTRIMVASADPRNQGTQGLEILFHEASHGLVDHLQRSISQECQKQHCYLPRRDLWHAVLFYTTGETVRRHVAGHVTYAERNHLWEGNAWPMYINALRKDWQDYLDGRAGFQAAISALVRDCSAPRSGQWKPGDSERKVSSK